MEGPGGPQKQPLSKKYIGKRKRLAWSEAAQRELYEALVHVELSLHEGATILTGKEALDHLKAGISACQEKIDFYQREIEQGRFDCLDDYYTQMACLEGFYTQVASCIKAQVDRMRDALDHGADPCSWRGIKYSDDVEALDDEQDGSPLHYAAENGEKAAVELLLDYGAPINAKDHNNDTALTIALRYGYSDLARCLLDRGAASDDYALYLAALSNDLPALLLVLRYRTSEDRHVSDVLLHNTILELSYNLEELKVELMMGVENAHTHVVDYILYIDHLLALELDLLAAGQLVNTMLESSDITEDARKKYKRIGDSIRQALTARHIAQLATSPSQDAAQENPLSILPPTMRFILSRFF